MKFLVLITLLLAPLEAFAYSCGKASWYKTGKITASGERFKPMALTAAHKHLPFGTKLKVMYKGRSVIVKINDRGPFIKGRHLDISKGAAKALGIKDKGVAVVCYTKM
jgi:rare lipoprotein A